MQYSMSIQDYYELVNAMLQRKATCSRRPDRDFFLCHSFYDDADYSSGAIKVPGQYFKSISPSSSQWVIREEILKPFNIATHGEGFCSREEWNQLTRAGDLPFGFCWSNIANTRRCIFLLCLRKEILDQIQQGNEVFDIEQIYKRLGA